MGREGINALVEQGIASCELIEWRLRHHELKDLFLSHQLMIVDLHCMRELAARGTTVNLADWRVGKEPWDNATATVGGERMEIPVCPDAFFALRDGSLPEAVTASTSSSKPTGQPRHTNGFRKK